MEYNFREIEKKWRQRWVENKTYKVYVNPFYNYDRPEDIEVKKKSDIEEYIGYLIINGFTKIVE